MSEAERFFVNESTPDGLVSVCVENMRRTVVELDGDVLLRYSVADLGRTLSRLMSRLWNEAFARRLANLRALGFDPRTDRRPHWDPRARLAEERLASIECEGESLEQYVTIRSWGFRTFEVDFDADVEGLGVAEIITEFNSAERDLMADWVTVRAETRREAYGWAK